MLPHLHFRFLVPGIGDQAPGKIQGVAVLIGDHLHRIGVLVVFRVHFRFAGGHFQIGIFRKSLGQVVDDLGRDHGFIPLDVDDHIHIFEIEGNFRQPVGAAGVVFRRHDGPAAKRMDAIQDPLVVSGHQHFIRDPGQCGPFIDPLDHGFAMDQSQGFPRQTSGPVTGRNYTEYFHFDAFSFLMAALMVSAKASSPLVIWISISRMYRGTSRWR